MKADCFHGFIFEIMITIKTNKIPYFIILSFTFHALLFIAWAGLIPLKKDNPYIDVFLVRDNYTFKSSTNIKNNHREIRKIPEIKKIEESPKEVFPEESNEIAVKTANTNFKPEESNKGIDINTNSNIFPNNSEKIIDTSFGTVNGPRFIHREIPVYPQIARRLGKEGKVVLRLTINEKGELISIEIIESAPYGFTESAIEAVKKSKFLPATKDGTPVASRALLPIKFVLKN